MKKKIILLSGVSFLVFGILLNQYVLAFLFSRDGSLIFSTCLKIWIFDFASLFVGIVILANRNDLAQNGVVRTLREVAGRHKQVCGFVFSCIVFVLLVLICEVVFYGLSVYEGHRGYVPAAYFDERGGRVALCERSEQCGAMLRPDVLIRSSRVVEGEKLYDVTYSIDGAGRRKIPGDDGSPREKFIILFGCSFTFGDGVNDDENMAACLAKEFPDYRIYNYGVPGAGPHNVLARLQSGNIGSEIKEKSGVAIYTLLYGHIDRAIGRMRIHGKWGSHEPYFMLNEGVVKRCGNFRSGRPVTAFLYELMAASYTLKYFNFDFPPYIRKTDAGLTAKIVCSAADEFRREFSDSRFCVLFYPLEGGKYTGYMKSIIKEHADVLDYSTLYDQSNYGKYRIAKVDRHPAAAGHLAVSGRLAKDLKRIMGEAP